MGKAKAKGKGLWAEFKAFISKGNAFMLAVGVVIGGAFSAIVNSLVNILLSVVTWAVPGGLKGLVTVLPALNDAQKGVTGIGQSFSSADLVQATIAYAKAQNVPITAESDTYVQWQNSLLTKYTLHGTTYTYNMSAVIDWGTFINAVISFIIIAIVLFIIVKVVNTAAAKKEAVKAKLQEEYYEKHPEERPVVPEPGAPAPTEMDILVQIRDELRAQRAEKEAK
ncbi:MAG: MscL family protein [Bacilli bacterium]|nr:MscL family protein [Bacilli bacterium]